ncbi:DUF1415 family protein, partial [Roseateles sp. GG27B]
MNSTSNSAALNPSAQQETQAWLEKAVIGLNLCPFAKSVHINKRLRYVVSTATTPEDLLKELAHEL